MMLIADKVDSVVQFFTVLLLFAIVLFVTFFVTKWLGNYQKMQNKGNNIEVIESVRISPSSFAQIVRIGSKYIAVAVSKENVTLLCELSSDDVVIKDDENTGLDFDSILNKVKAGLPACNRQDGDSNRDDE